MRDAIGKLSYERQILIVYILAVFITVIDGTMVNVALPTMADDFGVAANEAEWVAVGYLLAVAAVIPAAGWLGDRFGSKRVFVSALAWFTALVNHLSVPALTAPLAADGAPAPALQVIGPEWGEHRLLSAADTFIERGILGVAEPAPSA